MSSQSLIERVIFCKKTAPLLATATATIFPDSLIRASSKLALIYPYTQLLPRPSSQRCPKMVGVIVPPHFNHKDRDVFLSFLNIYLNYVTWFPLSEFLTQFFV